MPPHYHTRTKAENELAMVLGYAGIRWQFIEMQMVTVLASALEIEERLAAGLFAKIQTFALKLELLEVAVMPKMLDAEWQQKWREICGFIRELSGDRNFLVHNMLVGHVQSDYSSIPKIGLTTAKRTAYDQQEIEELEDDFHQAYVNLLLVDSCVRNGQSSLDKHRGLKVRRRPSRTERLEARKRKPPRQRKPSRKST